MAPIVLPYVLITAARNEDAYIGDVLESVAAQTHRPRAWIVVSDGSTDGTDALVADYARRCPFIRLMRKPADGTRNFGSKARAVNEAFSTLAEFDFDCVGIVDADVSFEDTYYELLLSRFADDARLGVGGGRVLDRFGSRFVTRPMSDHWSVRGPIQMFRRACFEQVGGYRVLTYGGVDAVAETTARMHGWTVRTFPDLLVHHHRTTGTESYGFVHAQFRLGRQNHVIGYHPLFELVRGIRRMAQRPYLLGGAALLAGYVWSLVAREPVEVPRDVATFLRHEQIQRLLGRSPMA